MYDVVIHTNQHTVGKGRAQKMNEILQFFSFQINHTAERMYILM